MIEGFTICDQRQDFIDCDSHCLLLGGPGSGKTTVALVKTAKMLADKRILQYQKILFLSFARATVSRVLEKINLHIDKSNRKFLTTNTYHGFAWSVLQSHGYLIGLSKNLKLLYPANAAALFAEIRNQKIHKAEKIKLERQELLRLAFNEGIISFDLFAELLAKLLFAHPRLGEILGKRYPLVILDEFQDSDPQEWEFIKQFGQHTNLIALADPNQRIYEFRGADAARIRHFLEEFKPTKFNFENENNRSAGTDIAIFGNDILDGTNKTKKYQNVKILKWNFTHQSCTYTLKTHVISAIRRLKAKSNQWSLAILVPTKRQMLTVSQALTRPEFQLPQIFHQVTIDAEGPTLAASIIAYLMEPLKSPAEALEILIQYLALYFKGRGGGSPTISDINEANNIIKAWEKGIQQKTISTSSRIKKAEILLNIIRTQKFQGEPEKDWVAIRDLLLSSGCSRLSQVAESAMYVRLLGKGTQLRENLASAWRKNQCYLNAMQIVEDAFKQEHFSSAVTPLKGVIVMNMHKAKGKEFDEVILFEDQYQGRFMSFSGDVDQSRRNFMVSVTRAKSMVTILTPSGDPSPLLF